MYVYKIRCTYYCVIFVYVISNWWKRRFGDRIFFWGGRGCFLYSIHFSIQNYTPIFVLETLNTLQKGTFSDCLGRVFFTFLPWHGSTHYFCISVVHIIPSTDNFFFNCSNATTTVISGYINVYIMLVV